MSRIRKGDTVLVIAGADRGKTGRVLRVDPRGGRVVVEGVNLKWKHVRKSQDNPQGGRSQREHPIQASNVAFLDAASGKGVRLVCDAVVLKPDPRTPVSGGVLKMVRFSG